MVQTEEDSATIFWVVTSHFHPESSTRGSMEGSDNFLGPIAKVILLLGPSLLEESVVNEEIEFAMEEDRGLNNLLSSSVSWSFESSIAARAERSRRCSS